MNNSESTVLIATLGGQPQIITFVLDDLLHQGISISEVVLLHTSLNNARIRHSVTCLKCQFDQDCYLHKNHPCKLRFLPIGKGDQQLDDIYNESDTEHALVSIRRVIANYKETGAILHLSISGGRRILGLLVNSVAALLCDHRDRVWHIYTPAKVRQAVAEGARMHATPDDGIQLIQIPLVPWGAYFPSLHTLTQPVGQEIEMRMQRLDLENEQRCRQVYQRLTSRQRKVLQKFAGGLRPQDVAGALSITVKTVDSHKTVILSHCRNAWNLPEKERLNFHFIREHFARFINRLAEDSTDEA